MLKYDYIFIGSGPACCASVKLLSDTYPNCKILIIERGKSLSNYPESDMSGKTGNFIYYLNR